MQVITGDEARDMLRREIGPEWGSAKRFAADHGISESLLYKVRYGSSPLIGKIARLLRVQQLWGEDRYAWVPERRATGGALANGMADGKAEKAIRPNC